VIRTSDFSLYYSATNQWADTVTSLRIFQAMQDALGILLEEVQVNVPRDTGDLESDANAKMIDFSPGKQVVGGVSMMKDGVQRPYAWMREKGGTIVPRPENKKQLLFWIDKGDGTLKVAKFVIQNGSFYMERSLENKTDQIVEKLAGAVTGAFEIFD